MFIIGFASASAFRPRREAIRWKSALCLADPSYQCTNVTWTSQLENYQSSLNQLLIASYLISHYVHQFFETAFIVDRTCRCKWESTVWRFIHSRSSSNDFDLLGNSACLDDTFRIEAEYAFGDCHNISPAGHGICVEDPDVTFWTELPSTLPEPRISNFDYRLLAITFNKGISRKDHECNCHT